MASVDEISRRMAEEAQEHVRMAERILAVVVDPELGLVVNVDNQIAFARAHIELAKLKTDEWWKLGRDV